MRLHNLGDQLHVDDQHFDPLYVDHRRQFTIESTRLADVDHAFPSLRYVNSRAKECRVDFVIVLDLSDDAALRSVLRQVS